jgi:hypothetical protein
MKSDVSGTRSAGRTCPQVQCLLRTYTTLMKGALRSYETPVNLHWVVRQHIPEQWYTTFCVRVPPSIISLQLRAPKVAGV